MKLSRVLTFVFLACSSWSALHGEEANPNEARLREALKATTLQLRTAQGDLASAQAAQAALAEEKKALSDQLAALRKQVATDKAVADKSASELAKKNSAQTQRIKELEQALAAAQSELRKSNELARTTKEKLEASETENSGLRRKVADRERRNLALFTIGNEILSRYEDYSLGKALLAKEPFIGSRRAKLETLVQDYEDQLLEQRATP